MITTTLHTYYYNTNDAEDAAAYREMCDTLQANGLKVLRFLASSNDSKASEHRKMLDSINGREIELESEHLFTNQWNTAPIDGISETGLRVFDWQENIWPNAAVKQGHWLEQTPSMREARRNTQKCGYCGNQEPAAKGYVFCPHCLDSEFLKEADFPLTRMVSVEDSDKPRAPLTEAERAHLLPLYRDAQIHGSTERGKARIAKARRDVQEKYEKAIRTATAERDGMLWLMDHGVDTNNVIYYSHTERFGFGWRAPLSDELVSALLDIITEFPFAYDIKGTTRTLSGER